VCDCDCEAFELVEESSKNAELVRGLLVMVQLSENVKVPAVYQGCTIGLTVMARAR